MLRHAIALATLAAVSGVQPLQAAGEADGFSLDMTPIELRRDQGRELFADMKEGDSAAIGWPEICRTGDDRLAARGMAEAWRELDIPALVLYATRVSSGLRLKLAEAEGGSFDFEAGRTRENAVYAAENLLKSPPCPVGENALSRVGGLIPILDINRAATLSGLIADAPQDDHGEAAGPRPATPDAPAAPVDQDSAPGTPEMEPEPTTEWFASRGTDKITDQENVLVIGQSIAPESLGFGESRGSIIFRCQRNVTNVYIALPSPQFGDQLDVDWRVDDQAPVSGSWNTSSNWEAVGLWSGGQAIRFIKRVVDGDTLTVRVRGRRNTFDMEFTLDGLRPHIEELSEACNWTLPPRPEAADDAEDEARAPARAQPDAGRAATDTAAADAPPLSDAQIGAIERQVARYWRKDRVLTLPGGENLVVEASIELDHSGHMKGRPMPSMAQPEGSSDLSRIAIQAARIAIERAAREGFSLPSESYPRWKTLRLRFDPGPGGVQVLGLNGNDT